MSDDQRDPLPYPLEPAHIGEAVEVAVVGLLAVAWLLYRAGRALAGV